MSSFQTPPGYLPGWTKQELLKSLTLLPNEGFTEVNPMKQAQEN